MKRVFFLICSSILMLSLAACSNSSNVLHSSATESTYSQITDPASDPQDSKPSSQQPKKIRVQFDGNTVIYELNNSQAATDLYNQLPLSLETEDFSNNEKIFYPPEKLDISDAPLAEGGSGTLAYYAPWGDVVMFYGNFQSNRSLYSLGQIVSGEEFISSISGAVSIDKIL